MKTTTTRVSTGPRKTPPTEPTSWNDEMSFRVWGNSPSFLEDERPWKCVACFRYLQEALDYIGYCHRQGSAVVFQSPTGCEEKRPAE